MKLKRIIYYVLISLMVFSIVFSIVVVFKPPTIIKEEGLATIPNEKIELSKDNNIEQYFVAKTENIIQIKIYIGKVTDKSGYIKITAYDDHDKELSSKKIKIEEIVPSTINVFDIDNINNVNGKCIHVKIETINTDSIVTVYKNNEYYPNQYIIYQGKKEKQTIVMYYEGEIKDKSLIVHFALILCTSAILALFLRDEITQERKFKDGRNKKK